MQIRNEDIREVTVGVPEGHWHVRTTIVLQDGTEITFPEAAMANMTRAFITLKTHPVKTSVRLRGRRVADPKTGYAEWQLLEE